MKSLSVYLASHYSRKEEIRAAVKDCESLGIKLTSTWHKERRSPTGSMKDDSETFLRVTAKRDFRELKSASCLVLFSLDGDTLFTRGGHCVELGMALSLRKRIVLVGPRQNVFCYLPGIKKFKTWEKALYWLVTKGAK